MVMPKDARASMWGGRERELLMVGWRVRRIPRPAKQKAETREYKTVEWPRYQDPPSPGLAELATLVNGFYLC